MVGYLAQRIRLVQLLKLEHPEGVATEYKRTAGRRLGDCDLKHDLDPKLAGLNLKDRDHEAMLRKIEEEREWTPWNICDGECFVIVCVCGVYVCDTRVAYVYPCGRTANVNKLVSVTLHVPF